MKSRVGRGCILATAIIAIWPSAGFALDLYTNNFDSLPAGTVVRPNDSLPYEFHGDTGVTLAEQITTSDGVNGTQSYQQNISASGAAYFYSGFGQYAVDPTNMPTGPDANNPAMYRFSADVKVSGNTVNTPVNFRVAGIDPDYETEHGIDVNNNGSLEGGAAVYTPTINPTISGTNQYVHISFTLDQGTQDVDPDVRPQDRVFSNSLALLWQASFNNGTFGVDNGNMVSVDNIKIEFLGQTGTGLPGDYNGDQKVDAADYTVWRDTVGSTSDLRANGDNAGGSAGVIDNADFAVWKSNFGTPGSGGLQQTTGVPEPSTLIVGLIALGSLVRQQSPRRRRPKPGSF